MKKYSIANLIIEMQCEYEPLISRLATYELKNTDESDKIDIKIDISEEMFQNTLDRFPQFGRGECEYMLCGDAFYKGLIEFDGMLLHASAVELDGEAFLFSANSGVGKSTHTHLWLDYFEKARILNDDKPAIRKINGAYYAFGTPFSGKTDESINTGVKLSSITFIERSENNWINKLTSDQSIPLILNQTIRPHASPKHMDLVLSLIDGLLKVVPVYKLGCNISKDAVKMAYQAIKGESL